MKRLIQFRSFMACVGKVKDILLLLRVEHQCVLVAPSLEFIHVLERLGVATLVCAGVDVVLVDCGEVFAQNDERSGKVLFLQDGMCINSHED